MNKHSGTMLVIILLAAVYILSSYISYKTDVEIANIRERVEHERQIAETERLKILVSLGQQRGLSEDDIVRILNLQKDDINASAISDF